MKKIPLTQGKYALVDDADYEWLSQWKWCAIKWGNTYAAIRNGRPNRKGHQEMIYMHRFIVGLCKGNKKQVDHINHNGLDNRRKNLRECTCQQNQWNYPKPKNKTSRYKGVCKHKSGGWTSSITINKKHTYLGYFKNEIDAAKTYDNAARKYFGRFAKTNFKRSA